MTTDQDFVIELLGFPQVADEDALQALASAFKISTAQAKQLFGRMPVRVKQTASKDEATHFVAVLRNVGARVAVQRGEARKIYEPPAKPSAPKPEAAPVADAARSAGITPAPVVSAEVASTKSDAVAPTHGFTREPSVLKQVAEHRACTRCGHEQDGGEKCAECGAMFANFERIPSVHVRAPRPKAKQRQGFASRLRARVPLRYVLSPKEDDRTFMGARRFDPARLLQLATESTAPVAVAGAATSSGGAGPGLSIEPIPLEPVPIEMDGSPEPGSTSRSGVARQSGHVEYIAPKLGPSRSTIAGLAPSADRTFWPHVGNSFLYSLKGPAYQWLFLFGFIGFMMWFVLSTWMQTPMIGMRLFGLVIFYFVLCAFLAGQWRFFFSAFSDAASGRDRGHSPMLELHDFKSEFIFPGVIISLLAILLYLPIIIIVVNAIFGSVPNVNSLNGTTLFLLGLIPLIYWPMGMTLLSAKGSFWDMFYVHEAARGIWAGKLEYLFIVALAVAWGFLHNLIASNQNMLMSLVTSFVGLGYLAGVQGYLMGKLLRVRPEMIVGTEVWSVDDYTAEDDEAE